MTLKEEIVGLTFNTNDLTILVNSYKEDSKLYEDTLENYVSFFGEYSRKFFVGIGQVLFEDSHQATANVTAKQPGWLAKLGLGGLGAGMAAMVTRMGIQKFMAWRARVAAAKGIVAKQQPMQPVSQQ